MLGSVVARPCSAPGDPSGTRPAARGFVDDRCTTPYASHAAIASVSTTTTPPSMTWRLTPPGSSGPSSVATSRSWSAIVVLVHTYALDDHRLAARRDRDLEGTG